MNSYNNLTKLETTRNCQRRIARHAEQEFSKDSIVNVMEKFVRSVNVMDDTILVPCRLMDRQVGDSTDVLLPNNETQTANQLTKPHSKRNNVHSKNVHEFLHASELLNLYNMLNSLKNELLWTGTDPAVEEEENSAFSVLEKSAGYEIDTIENKNNNNNSSNAKNSESKRQGHARRPSMSSVASVTSVGNLSDDSEMCNESDSGMESESHKDGQSSAGSVSSSDDVHHTQNLDKATELAKRCKRHLNGLYRCLEQMTEAANYLTARYQSDIGPV